MLRPPREVSRLPSPEGGVSRLPPPPPPSVSCRNCDRGGCVCLQLLVSPPSPSPSAVGTRLVARPPGPPCWQVGPTSTPRAQAAPTSAGCGRAGGSVRAPRPRGPQGSAGPAGCARGSGLGPRGARAHRRPAGELQVPGDCGLARRGAGRGCGLRAPGAACPRRRAEARSRAAGHSRAGRASPPRAGAAGFLRTSQLPLQDPLPC